MNRTRTSEVWVGIFTRNLYIVLNPSSKALKISSDGGAWIVKSVNPDYMSIVKIK